MPYFIDSLMQFFSTTFNISEIRVCPASNGIFALFCSLIGRVFTFFVVPKLILLLMVSEELCSKLDGAK